MNRKQFAESLGASCNNWRFAWSYVNHDKRFVLFGAWKHHTNNGVTMIFAQNWERDEKGRRKNGFGSSKTHLELIQEEEYRLFVFKQTAVPGTETGTAKLDSFTSQETPARLVQIDEQYFAAPYDDLSISKVSNGSDSTYEEGEARIVTQTQYERSPEARAACLLQHGYSCSVCDFDFEEKFGDVGKKYIHVHHLTPVSARKRPYRVNGKDELRPVCPNCHAMIHKRNPPYTIDEIRKIRRS